MEDEDWHYEEGGEEEEAEIDEEVDEDDSEGGDEQKQKIAEEEAEDEGTAEEDGAEDENEDPEEEDEEGEEGDEESDLDNYEGYSGIYGNALQLTHANTSKARRLVLSFPWGIGCAKMIDWTIRFVSASSGLLAWSPDSGGAPHQADHEVKILGNIFKVLGPHQCAVADWRTFL